MAMGGERLYRIHGELGNRGLLQHALMMCAVGQWQRSCVSGIAQGARWKCWVRARPRQRRSALLPPLAGEVHALAHWHNLPCLSHRADPFVARQHEFQVRLLSFPSSHHADCRSCRFMHIDQNSLVPLEDQPTFNSNVVEAWLFRIPGLTPQFIGLNDDYYFKSPIHPSRFFTVDRGVKIYLEPWFMGLAADRVGDRVSRLLFSVPRAK